MPRLPRRSRPQDPTVGPVPSTWDAGVADATRIAGYRPVRLVGRGAGVDTYLAAASAVEGPEDSAHLVMLRIHDADADLAALGAEIEAMTVGLSALPELLDVAMLDDGRICLVVERLAGPSLARIVVSRPLAPGEAVTTLAPIAVAVGELARAGFAHLGLDAGDVVFDATGRPRLDGTRGLVRLGATRAGTPDVDVLRAAHGAFGRLVDAVAEATEPPARFDVVREAIRTRLDARPFQSDTTEYERLLFEVARPEPVRGAWDDRRQVPSRIAPRTPDGLPSGYRSGGVQGSPDDRASARVLDTSPVTAAASGARTTAREARGVDLPGASVEARSLGTRRASGHPGGLLGALLGTPAVDRIDADERSAGDAARSSFPLSGVIERVRAAMRRRRSVLLVGGLSGGAALVLLLTLVTPAPAPGATSVADAARGPSSASQPASQPAGDAPDPSAVPSAGGPQGGAEDAPSAAGDGVREDAPAPEPDAGVTAADLLERRADCIARLDLECLDTVDQAGSAIAEADRRSVLEGRDGRAVAGHPFDLAAVVPQTAMGDAVLVAVPYLEAEREPASVLMMRTEAGWRLRELFD
ncbi:hypothetical protein ACDF64_13695 [Agromyces sp. MMS24-JH15]|uniref:hypothetical protein n=1 Tax=Agromyces sp. MMS24-JH15 TaxID=3243765 RepID=UPI0037480447